MIAITEPRAAFPATDLVPVPPRVGCETSVVIPVRDEEDSLPATLAALATQCDLAGNPFDYARYEVILLVNNSVDASAIVARTFAHHHPSFALHVIEVDLPEDEAHVGRARRILMDAATRRLPAGGVIAMSDADTVVAPDWIATMLAEFSRGVDAVAGRIMVDPAGFAVHGYQARLLHLRDVTYRYLVSELESWLDPDPFDPWPRHFQHFGPSMAVTVDIYRRVGGIPPLPSLEDVAFYDALRGIGARIRHSPVVRVVTSARPEGRTGFGFAVQLGRWSEMGVRGEPFLVESLNTIIARVSARRDGDIADPRVSRYPLVPIETAIAELRHHLSALRSETSNSVHALEQIDPVRFLAAAD